MIFRFLKYLQPTHYFQLFTKTKASVFPKVELLPDSILRQLEVNTNYKSKIAQNYDLSWQAIQQGYIGKTETHTQFEDLSAHDNYIFIRTYFHSAWVFYVFVLRLFQFYNPIIEFKAWLATRYIKRNGERNIIEYPNWNTYNSILINKNPKVSVIIPTLNRYHVLKDVLSDFEQQDYTNFEVIIVDQSKPFKKEFYKDFNLNINLIRQEEKALWLARNTAIKNSKGEFIALSEDDVRIQPDWIRLHLKCLDFFNAKVSAGVFYPKGKSIPKERSYFTLASQFATGNAMLYKNVFKKVGLFDRQFEKQRMGDGEFGMRIYLENIKSISNPFASCIDIKESTGGLREMGSWDAFRPSNFFAPRPIPSVLYYFRRYYGNSRARLSLLRTVPLSIFPYQYKKNKLVLVLALCVTILIIPIVFYQVFKSWKLASKKIKEGTLIETLM